MTRITVGTFVFLVTGTIAACGSSGAADEASNGDCVPVGQKACPDDDAVTEDDFAACTAAKASPCGPSYVAALECVGKNIVCNAAGMTDTATLDSKCGDQEAAYTACTSQNASDAGS